MPETKPVDNEKLYDKLGKIAEHLDTLHARMDSWDEQRKADRARLDAVENADKARADAEEKAKSDTAETIAARVADAEAKTATEGDRAEFAKAQMRCDAAYQAWSHQAPHALHGETLRDFQIRLLTPLKRHSKVYKDSALSLIGDDAAFTVIQDAVIADAIEASNSSYTAMAPLRKITTKSDSGHVVTKWVGDPAVAWAPFMGGATRFCRINSDMANKSRN